MWKSLYKFVSCYNSWFCCGNPHVALDNHPMDVFLEIPWIAGIAGALQRKQWKTPRPPRGENVPSRTGRWRVLVGDDLGWHDREKMKIIWCQLKLLRSQLAMNQWHVARGGKRESIDFIDIYKHTIQCDIIWQDTILYIALWSKKFN